MIGLAWTNYVYHPAPRSLLCQFRRQDGDYLWQFVGYAKDFLSVFNVAGLEWKLTGIARVELDRMPDEQRRQMFGVMSSSWHLGNFGGMSGNMLGAFASMNQAQSVAFASRNQAQFAVFGSGCSTMRCIDALLC
jgi:hypothetical protein